MRDDRHIPSLTADLNRVLLVGVLADAPELRELPSGEAVCFLRLECASGGMRRGEGEGAREAVCVDSLILGAAAARIAPYLYAGRKVVVDGSIEAASWEGEDARECQAVCVLAHRVEFIGPPPEGMVPSPGQQGGTGIIAARDTSPPPAEHAPADTSAAVGFSEDMWF